MLKSLSFRLNFVNDEGISDFVDKVVMSGKTKLEAVYLNENNLTIVKAQELSMKIKEAKLTLFVDRFEKTQYMPQPGEVMSLKKTLFVCLDKNCDTRFATSQIKTFLNQFDMKKVGIMRKPVRVRIGRKIWNKTSEYNAYAFVDFEDVASIAKASRLNANKKLLWGYKTYLAGTQTFTHIRASGHK